MTENGGTTTGPLANLKARREAIVEKQVFRHQVPRWEDPEIFVECKPLPHPTIRSIEIKHEKMRDRGEAEVQQNATLLVRACDRIYAVLDGKEFSLDLENPDGPGTKFDDALAANLGLEGEVSGTMVARTLFITEADLMVCAREYLKWVGYVDAKAAEDFSGE